MIFNNKKNFKCHLIYEYCEFDAILFTMHKNNRYIFFPG